jgi:hypothetical protein
MDFASIKFTSFFDRAAVVNAMSEKERKVLAKTGGFARTTMKRGMRKKPYNVVSQPGQYPYSHAGHLRDLIYFAYEFTSGSVVTGPLLFTVRGSKRRSKIAGNQTVPELINEGGFVTTKRKRKRYRARPFVALTREKTLPVFRRNMQDIPL